MKLVQYKQEPYHQDKRILINCCGDFQIAHRDLWFTIKGFNENSFLSIL